MILRFFLFLGLLMATPALARTIDGDLAILIEDMVSEEFKANVAVAQGADPEKTFDALAMTAVLDNTLPVAIWAYKRALDENGQDAVNLSNLAVLLADLGAAANEPGLVSVAEDMLIEAITLQPSDWTGYHQLGALYLKRHGAGGPDSDLKLAGMLLLKATELNPDSATAWMKLGEILQAMGDPKADAVFRRAFLMEPANVAVMRGYSTVKGFDDIVAPDEPQQCSIDFKCDTVCPVTAIIPGLEHVQCEIAETNAELMCMKGLPFQTRFDCETEKPAFGILIPGLHPGVSIITPWGSATIIADGDRFRFEFSFAKEIPGAKNALKGGLAAGWDSKTGGHVEGIAGRKIGGAMGLNGEVRSGLRYDSKTGDISYSGSGKVSGSLPLPKQGTLDAAKAAGLPGNGSVSASTSTTGKVTGVLQAYGGKVTTKFRVLPN